MMRGMVIDMKDEQLRTLAQLQALVDGTVAVGFAVTGEQRYGFIARHPTALRLRAPKTTRQGRGAALSGARERLFAPAAHAAGRARA